MSGISHVSVGTNDLLRARVFYEPLLKILGLTVRKESAGAVDYGNERLVFSLETPVDGAPATPGNGIHIAFSAPDRGTVDEFYALAMQLGARDAGPPGLRTALQREVLRRLRIRS